MNSAFRDLLCPSCNRGVWSERPILVTVYPTQIVRLSSVTKLECYFCGRKAILEIADGVATLYAALHPAAKDAITRAIAAEWPSKFEAKGG